MIKFLTLFIISLQVNAEYRVYQYTVKNNISSSKNISKLNIIESTLNPVSYKAYHGGDLISISLLRTWICPGHTANKSICPSPYKKMESLNE